MSVLTTELFRIVTCAAEDEVWEALTLTGQPLCYFYGMTVTSDWLPGSPLTMTGPWDQRLEGTVLAAQRPGRLSYTIGAGADEVAACVTWELRRCPTGTVVRLYVDEAGAGRGASNDLEDAWLPVLQGLATHLATSPKIPSKSAPGEPFGGI